MPKMPYNEVQKRATAKYNAKAYDELKIRVDKGRKTNLQSHAAARGESLNGFVNRAIDEAVERDNGKELTRGADADASS
jgi:predicted HicB family RNase H-like nuclease